MPGGWSWVAVLDKWIGTTVNVGAENLEFESHWFFHIKTFFLNL